MLSSIIKELEQEYNRKLTLKESAIVYSIYEQGKKDGKAEQRVEIMKILNK